MRQLLEKRSLKSRIWLLALCIWIPFLLLASHWITASRAQLQILFQFKINAVMQGASFQAERLDWADAPSALAGAFHAAENDPDIAFLHLADARGNTVYSFQTEKFQALLAGFMAKTVLYEDTNGYVIVKQPIIQTDQMRGNLIAGFTRQRLQAEMDRQRWRAYLYILLFSALLAVLGLIFARYVSEPVTSAAETITHYQKEGERIYVRLPEDGGGELGRLARAFNRLADATDQRLEDSIRYQNYLEAFFALSPMPIIITDTIGNVEKANRSACALFELNMEGMLKSHLENLLGPANFNAIKNHINESGENIRGYVGVITMPDGVQKIVEVHLSLLFNAQRALKNFIISLINVTDSMRTQQEILAERVQSNEARRVKEPEYGVPEYALKLEKLAQVSYKVAQCQSVVQLLDKFVIEGRDLIDAAESRVYLWEKQKRHMLPAKAAPEQKIKLLHPLVESSGIVWKTFQDNRPYHWSSESLQERDYRDLGLAADQHYNIFSVPISDEDFRYGVAVYIQPHPEALAVEDLRFITQFAQQAAITLNRIYLSQRLKDKSRQLTAQDELLDNFRRQTAQQQQFANLGKLIGGVAHDFNNILGIMKPNIDLLHQETREQPVLHKRIGAIRGAIDSAMDLIRQLFLVSRNSRSAPADLAVNELLEELATLFRRILSKDFQLETDLAPGLPQIKIDRIQLQQIVMNLTINARDAMPEGGKILYRTGLAAYAPSTGVTAREYVRISVSDTGSGIPEQYLDRIFEPFFTTKAEGKGTGLGLSIVRDIVTSHHGYVKVDTASGKGTCFEVYLLPVEKSRTPRTKARAPKSSL